MRSGVLGSDVKPVADASVVYSKTLQVYAKPGSCLKFVITVQF